jgi:hypothetical protein
MSKNIKTQSINGEAIQTASGIDRNYDMMPNNLIQINSESSSLTTEEKKPRKGPRPKKSLYPMSAPVSAIRRSVPLTQFDESIEWLNTEVAGAYLHCSPAAIRMKRRRGQIKGHRPFGGRWYFKRSDLDRAIESSNKGGTNGNS